MKWTYKNLVWFYIYNIETLRVAYVISPKKVYKYHKHTDAEPLMNLNEFSSIEDAKRFVEAHYATGA